MNASKIGLIAAREYRTRVFTRRFVVITIIQAVAALLIASAPVIIQAIRGDRSEKRESVVVTDYARLSEDDHTLLGTQLQAALGANTAIQFTPVGANPPGAGTITANNVLGLLMIERNPAGSLTFRYVTNRDASDQSITQVRQVATALVTRDRLQQAGLSPAQQTQIFAPPAFNVQAKQTSDTDPNAGAQKATRYALAYFLDIFLYTTIILYGAWVAGGVAEEKSNRVMEIMINAATPTELMAGKITGIGAAALTQYLCTIIPAGLALAFQGSIAQALFGKRTGATALDLSALSVKAFGAFLGFFMLGFLLYAALYAALGSTVSRQEEVQQTAAPMTMFVLVGFFGAIYTLSNPDAPIARVLSFIPFTSPLVMLTRIIVGNPAAWEVALSVGILIVSVAGAIVLAARIYRIGVLLYGERLSLRRVLQLSRTPAAR